jgi:type II secretory pathway component GspD/PulD (secretin)
MSRMIPNMSFRTALIVLLLLFVPLTGYAAKKKRPLLLEVSPSSGGLPLVTLTASGVPLGEVAERLSKKLGTTIDVSPAARSFQVTTELDQQPLDLTLRELAPQAYVDGILSGGTGKLAILAIHLRTAGEAAPPLTELEKRSSETIMFFGHTEDPSIDPLEGQLAVTYRNDRLRVSGKGQLLSVVVARVADVLRIPFELTGDSREVIDIAVADATIEQVMSAFTPSVKLYLRKDLATFRTTPVRLVVQEPVRPATPEP